MLFDTFGPFELEKKHRDGLIGGDDKKVEPRWHADFWNTVDRQVEGLSDAIGCYAFCLRHGRNTQPFYVGKTGAKGGFRVEALHEHKRRIYSELIESFPKKTPELMFFPLMTTNWAFSKNRSRGKSTIAWLENTLIGMSLAVNPDMANKRQTQYLREVYVNGLIGGQVGRPSASADRAKRIWGIKS